MRLFLFTLTILMFSITSISAEETISVRDTNRGWYVGVEGGMPFGYGSFSSFGHDKTRVGYNVGVYGGYRFNPVLSAELSAKWGQTSLSAHGCCVDAGYWLGADDNRYYAPVFGQIGWNYADLKSRVNLQQYGARLNVNLLGFFNSTKASGWMLDVSPAVYAVGTKADIMTIANSKKVMGKDQEWHFGYGGRVQLDYMVTRNLSIGVYSEFTSLTGNQLDGVAEIYHDDNFIWESGIRIGWTFGKCGKKINHPNPEDQEPAIQETIVEEIRTPEQQKSEIVVAVEEVKVMPAEQAVKEIVFPVIYFDFDKSDIKSGELAKLQDIICILNENPDMKICISGWADSVGGTAVNKRISLRRAEAVSAWLVSQGIDASRIEVLGMGIDRSEQDASKARRVEVEKQ